MLVLMFSATSVSWELLARIARRKPDSDLGATKVAKIPSCARAGYGSYMNYFPPVAGGRPFPLPRNSPMPSYKAPVDDTLFLLRDVLDYGRYGNLPRFGEAPLDVVEAVLSEGGKLAEEVLQPLNRSGDQRGLRARAPTAR